MMFHSHTTIEEEDSTLFFDYLFKQKQKQNMKFFIFRIKKFLPDKIISPLSHVGPEK